RALVRLASLLLDDVATCEEVVQDAFVHVWRRPPALRDETRLAAYQRSAVLNWARSQRRRRGVRRRHLRSVGPPPTAPAAEATALAGDADDAVLRALRALPDRQREVLALRYYLDLSEAEIAATLGVSAGSVKTHAHRGLRALAEALEGHQ
ncbi:MAG TPA: sigma-70 family RNA polymerase sigma factor, partial [Acidimicrobiales bacterium]|nr:sigma-70 family RNA polymerase sigma factor [Acidimicrobiales bacterium]